MAQSIPVTQIAQDAGLDQQIAETLAAIRRGDPIVIRLRSCGLRGTGISIFWNASTSRQIGFF